MNKWTKKHVNCFLQDCASAGIRSLQSYIVTLCRTPGNGLQIDRKRSTLNFLPKTWICKSQINWPEMVSVLSFRLTGMEKFIETFREC